MNERPAQEQCKPKAKWRKKLFESLSRFRTLGKKGFTNAAKRKIAFLNQEL